MHQNHLGLFLQIRMFGDSELVSLEWGLACKLENSVGDDTVYSLLRTLAIERNFIYQMVPIAHFHKCVFFLSL